MGSSAASSFSSLPPERRGAALVRAFGLVSLFVCYRLLPPIKHPEAGRNIDYVGAAVFALAIAPILIGLTNKQTGQWTDPAVGGLIVLGLGIVVLQIFSFQLELVAPTVRHNPPTFGEGSRSRC